MGPPGSSASAERRILPSFVLWPWNNPPTTTTPGTIYLANLSGVSGLTGISGSGGAYIHLSGTTAIVHVDYSGLTSGVTSERIYAAPVGNNPATLLFDLGAQDKNYSNLKTSDGGYTWTNADTTDV